MFGLEFWLNRAESVNGRFSPVETKPGVPEIDPDFLLDTICTFEKFVQASKETAKPLTSVRPAKDKFVCWFDPIDKTTYKAVMLSLKGPRTAFVRYTYRHTWKTNFCSSDVAEGELELQMLIAVGLAERVYKGWFRERDIDHSA